MVSGRFARVEPMLAEDVEGAFAIPVLPRDGGQKVDLRLLAAQLEAQIDAGLLGILAGGAAGDLAELDEEQAWAVHGLLLDVGHGAGRPVVFDASQRDPRRALARIEACGELEPAAWLVRPPLGLGDDRSDDGPANACDLNILARLARAAAPATLVMEEPHPGAFDARSLARWAQAVPALVGARILPRAEEGWAELAAVTEELALFACGREWASAHRWGARGCAGELASLSPTAAAALGELLERDVQHALREERRYLHFLEAHVLPALRSREPSPARLERLLALAGGWCDLGPGGAREFERGDVERVRRAAGDWFTGAGETRPRT